MTVLDENKNQMYFHINEAIYSKDFNSRVLISKNYMEDEITLIYQVNYCFSHGEIFIFPKFS